LEAVGLQLLKLRHGPSHLGEGHPPGELMRL
jgi:hypothetical protein